MPDDVGGLVLNAFIGRLHTVTWVLIFVGLGVVGLGISWQRTSPTTGAVVIAIGAAATLLGVLLVWLRSRIRDPD